MSDDPKCPSCGVPYTDHLGLEGTCRIKNVMRYENEYLREIKKAARKLCDCNNSTDPDFLEALAELRDAIGGDDAR